VYNGTEQTGVGANDGYTLAGATAIDAGTYTRPPSWRRLHLVRRTFADVRSNGPSAPRALNPPRHGKRPDLHGLRAEAAVTVVLDAQTLDTANYQPISIAALEQARRTLSSRALAIQRHRLWHVRIDARDIADVAHRHNRRTAFYTARGSNP
jgi:hypothetical protein